MYIAYLLIAPLRLLAWMTNKLIDIIYDIQKAYRSNLERAIEDEVRKVSRVSGLKRADLQRISPTIYDATKCFASTQWWLFLFKAVRRHPGPSATGLPRRAPLGMGDALFVLFLAFLAVVLGIGVIRVLLEGASGPSLTGLTAVDVIAAICVWGILFIVRKVVHRYLPYTYITLSLLVEYLFAELVLHTYNEWASAVVDAWRSIHASMPFKYRVLLPTIQPGRVIQVAVWLTAIECMIRFIIRVVRYVGTQISIRSIGSRRFPTYGAAAEQSAVLIILFLRACYSLSEWEQNLPLESDPELRAIAARIPPTELLFKIDAILGNMAWILLGPWKDAMRSSIRTPGRRTVGQQMAHEASRIAYFLQCQRVKTMLGGTNFIKLREVMTTALVQSADGDWHLIGRGEEYEVGAIAGRWKTVLRRLIAIAIPIALAIGVSEFARKIPTPYIQAILLTCLGFAAVQFLGLIDPEAPSRLDVASKISGILKR